MTLIVEDGTGKSDAESYEDIAGADDYLEKWEDPPPTNWFGVKAAGPLSIEVIPTDTETVTIGTKVYTFKDAITAADGDVAIGTSVAESRTNLFAAVNLSGTAGAQYGANTTIHPDVSGLSTEGAVTFYEAKLYGDIGNGIATTTTMVGTGNAWGAATLTGGSDPTVSDVAKERHLRIATRRVDVEGQGRWLGVKLAQDQALDHPRANIRDTDGIWIDYDPLPKDLQNSTALFALASANGDDLYPDVTESGGLEAKTIRIEGAVTISKKWGAGSNPTSKEFRMATALLAPLLESSDRVFRS